MANFLCIRSKLKTQSFVFINETCVYKNEACIYKNKVLRFEFALDKR